VVLGIGAHHLGARQDVGEPGQRHEFVGVRLGATCVVPDDDRAAKDQRHAVQRVREAAVQQLN